MPINIQKSPKSDSYAKYSAFTLVEMLIVMAILVTLFGIIISSFTGMKDSLSLSDATYTLAQDIRYAQRSSLFLKRDSKERWIYGVGIDLNSSIINSTGSYPIFKWCSPFNDYDANGDVRMISELPSYDPSLQFTDLITGKKNASIPTTYDSASDYCAKCVGSNCTSPEVLNPLKGYGLTKLGNGIQVEFLNASGVVISTGYPRFILFESITGRAFFYNESGTLMNYYKDINGLHIGKVGGGAADEVKIRLKSPSGQTSLITIKPVSGSIKIN
jgi:type II secretory pathway pseudopilin PulG